MKRIALTLTILAMIALSIDRVFATPSTTYWTPATTDIQPFGILHLGVDN